MFPKTNALSSLVLFVAIFAACGLVTAQSAAHTVAPSSGKELCSALTPADFVKAGVPVTAFSKANLDNNANAYCMYASQAGGVEFHIFFPAGDTDADVKATERTVWREVGGKFQPVHVPGADDAQSNAAAGGQAGSATIAVRKGKAVFDINIPAGPHAEQQLLTLSQTVLSRLKP